MGPADEHSAYDVVWQTLCTWKSMQYNTISSDGALDCNVADLMLDRTSEKHMQKSENPRIVPTPSLFLRIVHGRLHP